LENTETKEAIDELEEAVNAVVKETAVERDRLAAFTRKIRFPQDGVVLPKARALKPDELDYWSLLVGKQLLEARHSVLPTQYEARLQELTQKRTMTSTGTDTGAELGEVAQSLALLRDVYLETKVMSALPAVQMPSGKMKLSQITSDAVFYKPSAEATAVTATDLATEEAEFNAATLKAQVDISDEFEEDSLLALLPSLRRILVQIAAQAIDEAILNGDASTGTQNINYYAASGGSSISTASRFLLGFDGLIHLALNEASSMTVDVGTLEAADFVAMLAKMEKYGVNPKSVLFITDLWTYLKAIQLTEVSTYDKMGEKATVSTGELSQIFGIPIIVSEQMAKANATGQVDQTSGNNTKGRIVAVNRDMWRVGLARPVQVRSERSESKTMTSFVVSFRLALQCFGTRSSAKHTALGYDVTV